MGNISQSDRSAKPSSSVIIAISGRTASGKTTLSKALAEAFGGTVGSFGDYVRKLAHDHGRNLNRGSLQTIGQTAVDAGASAFLEDFLSELGGIPVGLLVLDGLRHIAVRDALRSLARAQNAELHFVYIETGDEQRALYLRTRGENKFTTSLHDAHASENDVRDRLRDEADLIVQGGKDKLAMIEVIRRRFIM